MLVNDKLPLINLKPYINYKLLTMEKKALDIIS